MDSKHLSGIYMITSIATTRFYIGSAKRLSARKHQHLDLLRKNNHYNPHLQNIYNKHGESDLVWSTLEIVDNVDLLLTREQFWMDLLHPDINISKDASSPMLGRKHSDKTKGKIRSARNPQNYAFNKKANKYQVRYGINNKDYQFGFYNTEDEAKTVRDYILSLSDQEKLKYHKANFSRKHNAKGYYYHKKSGKWVVKLTIKGCVRSFGSYKTEEEAIDRVAKIRLESYIKD